MQVVVYNRLKDAARVTAMQWTGNNIDEMSQFTKSKSQFNRPYFGDGTVEMLLHSSAYGQVKCKVGDWIVRDVRGLYPVSDGVFTKEYEPATK